MRWSGNRALAQVLVVKRDGRDGPNQMAGERAQPTLRATSSRRSKGTVSRINRVCTRSDRAPDTIPREAALGPARFVLPIYLVTRRKLVRTTLCSSNPDPPGEPAIIRPESEGRVREKAPATRAGASVNADRSRWRQVSVGRLTSQDRIAPEPEPLPYLLARCSRVPASQGRR